MGNDGLCHRSWSSPRRIFSTLFGNEACFKVEEVQESNQNECPGLAIVQRGPCLYRCSLQLPEISVSSGTFKKKKEAEQSASELALQKVSFIFLSLSYHPFLYFIINSPSTLSAITVGFMDSEV